MKKAKILIFYIFIIICNNTIYTQEKDSEKDKGSKDVPFFYIDNIRLRKSFDCVDDFTKPAELNITIPKEDKNKFLIDAAIGFDILHYDKLDSSFIYYLTISPIVEYHLNNETKYKQNILQFGMFTDWQLFSILKKKYSPILNTKFSYNIDFENETSSISFSEYITFKFKNNNIFKYLLPQMSYSKNKIISYAYYPSIGFEYNNKILVKTEGKKGPNLNYYTRILLNLYPFEDFFASRIEIQSDFVYRYYFIDVSQTYGRYKKLFIQSLNFLLYDKGKSSVGLGIDYTYGDDPTKSLYNLDKWSFALKIKF